MLCVDLYKVWKRRLWTLSTSHKRSERSMTKTRGAYSLSISGAREMRGTKKRNSAPKYSSRMISRALQRKRVSIFQT